jgi:hypothetical protein
MIDEEGLNRAYHATIERIRLTTGLTYDDLRPADAAEIRRDLRAAYTQLESSKSDNSFSSGQPSAQVAYLWMESNLGLRVQTQGDAYELRCIQRELLAGRKYTDGIPGDRFSYIPEYVSFFRNKLKDVRDERELL